MSLSEWMRLEDCCYRCVVCGLVACHHREASPGEDQHICAACVEVYGPHEAVTP